MLRNEFKVRGLCGTLTWNQHDDFTTPEGDVENSVSSFAGKLITNHCSLPSGSPAEPCATFTQRRRYAESVCSIIHGPVFQVAYRNSPSLSAYAPAALFTPGLVLSCRLVMMWWRGSPTSFSVCQRLVAALHKRPVTAPSSLPTPDTVLRRASQSSGATTPSAVSG